MLIFHIISALSSILLATSLIYKPSRLGLKFSYGLIIFTFLSGTYLIITNPAHMVASCFSGLAYFGVITSLVWIARQKLSKLDLEK